MHVIAMLGNVPAAMNVRIISTEALRGQAAARPPGYAEDVIAHGVIAGDKLLITEEEYVRLCRKYRGDSRAWPWWARALKLIARPGDIGVGDVVARTIGPENSVAFKAWFKKTFNKDCGCTGRESEWNIMYPLP